MCDEGERRGGAEGGMSDLPIRPDVPDPRPVSLPATYPLNDIRHWLHASPFWPETAAHIARVYASVLPGVDIWPSPVGWGQPNYVERRAVASQPLMSDRERAARGVAYWSEVQRTQGAGWGGP